jgi:hypothetical protein
MLVDGFSLSFAIALEDWLSIGVDLVLVNLLNHFNFDANSTESLPTHCATLRTVYINLGMCTVNSCKSPEIGSIKFDQQRDVLILEVFTVLYPGEHAVCLG